MKREPLLSIVIPTYNSIRTIFECIDSIEICNCEGLEIIVVDDGSSDGTVDAVSSKYGNWDSVKIVQQDHLGPLGARIRGVHAANGTYIWFVDSDDTIASAALETILNTLSSLQKQADEPLIIGGYRVVGKTNTFISESSDKYVSVKQALITACTSDNLNPLWRFVIPKKILSVVLEKGALSRCPEYYGEDAYLMLCIMLESSGLLQVDAPIYIYHQTEGSLSCTLSFNAILIRASNDPHLLRKRMECLELMDAEATTYESFQSNLLYHLLQVIHSFFRLKKCERNQKRFRQLAFCIKKNWSNLVENPEHKKGLKYLFRGANRRAYAYFLLQSAKSKVHEQLLRR